MRLFQENADFFRQMSRFAVIGAFLGCIDLALFCALVACGVTYEWANVAGIVVGYALGLVLHNTFTFRRQGNLGVAMAQKYFVVFLLSLGLGSGVLSGVLALTATPALAKGMSMMTVAASNFFLGRRFVFA